MRKNSSQLEKSLASWTKTLSVLVWFHDLWLNLQPIHNSNKTDSFGGHQQRLEFQLFLTQTGPKMDYALNIVRKTISFRNGDLQRHFLQTLVYLMHWASTSSINQGRKTNNLEDIVTLNNLTRTLVTQFYAPSITLRWPLKSNYSTKPSAAKHEKGLHRPDILFSNRQSRWLKLFGFPARLRSPSGIAGQSSLIRAKKFQSLLKLFMTTTHQED